MVIRMDRMRPLTVWTVWSFAHPSVQNCANYFVIVRIVKTLLELIEGYNVLHTIVQYCTNCLV